MRSLNAEGGEKGKAMGIATVIKNCDRSSGGESESQE